jgi:hypothetical protein
MLDTQRGGLEEQPPRHPLNSTQIFAGPHDGLSQTYNGVSTFVGLQGHSQKAGYRVIFPTLDMGRYLEIAEADILETEDLSPDHSPFGVLGGTRVSVREAAPILTSRAVPDTLEVDEEFDLDLRLGASGWSVPPGMHAPDEALYAPGQEGAERQALPIKTNGACPTGTCKTCATCEGKTCITCVTCAGDNTCQTCHTHCGQNTSQTCKADATCAETCQTCQTQCGQNTCQTCKNDATCQTCQTCKGDATCHTCATLCEQATCGATCHTCVDKGCVPPTQTCCKDTCV